MTPEEKFVFDLDGYLLLKQVLNADEVAQLNELADAAIAQERGGPVSSWGPAFLNLMDHPGIIPYLLELIGPKFRADHDYPIFMRQGERIGGLHGGPQGGVYPEADHWYRYHDGVMRNGLTVFTYCLSPVRAGDGGFACVPGSHKSNFVAAIPDGVRNFTQPAHYVRQPEVEAGDVIIFTEALVHGTMTWTASHQRRALLYKFSPGHSSWAQNYYQAADYPQATPQQQRILAPPSVGNRPDSVEVSA
ncbi:MAG: hypothetical protein GKR89_07725 [Candidatus Latescibacteria bacterium]|nr:hypothetical protein [Candidatus Latescibacterota bacterium]